MYSRFGTRGGFVEGSSDYVIDWDARQRKVESKALHKARAAAVQASKFLESAPPPPFRGKYVYVHPVRATSAVPQSKQAAPAPRVGDKRGACLDNGVESDTGVEGVLSECSVFNRVRVYRSGEIETRTISRQAASKRPPASRMQDLGENVGQNPFVDPDSGKLVPVRRRRWLKGVSGRGAAKIRRSVSAVVKHEDCQVAHYVLTSQPIISDDEFKRRLRNFLMWGRKYCALYFKYFVWVVEPQARGVLHAHLLLFKRIPKGLWRRMRNLWAVTYGMGEGSMHVRSIRQASRAAAYLAKVCSYMCKEDADGQKIGRNGEAYLTEWFTGNAYGISDALRYYGGHVAEYHLPWGSSFVAELARRCDKKLHLRGFVYFGNTRASSLALVSSVLDSC